MNFKLRSDRGDKQEILDELFDEFSFTHMIVTEKSNTIASPYETSLGKRKFSTSFTVSFRTFNLSGKSNNLLDPIWSFSKHLIKHFPLILFFTSWSFIHIWHPSFYFIIIHITMLPLVSLWFTHFKFDKLWNISHEWFSSSLQYKTQTIPK